MPGPPPKRSEERRRRNDPAAGAPVKVDLDRIAEGEDEDSLPFLIAQPVKIPTIPRAGDEDEETPNPADWHPFAVELWESFSRSGQALFWEPSDWMVAKIICESISRDLKPQFVGSTQGTESYPSEPIYERIPLKGASLGAYLKAFGQLMLTEGERRRLSIELERTRLASQTGDDGEAKVIKIKDRRQAQLIAKQRRTS